MGGYSAHCAGEKGVGAAACSVLQCLERGQPDSHAYMERSLCCADTPALPFSAAVTAEGENKICLLFGKPHGKLSPTAG